MATDPALWLRAGVRPPHPALTLIALPHAGGGASTFSRWRTPLAAAEIALLAVQYPGQEERFAEPPCRDAAGIVEPVADAIAATIDTEYALFGHSLGALLAFAIARTLRARGRPPAHLFVSGCRAPDVPDAGPLRYQQTDAEFQEYLRGVGGLSDEVLQHPELVAVMLPAIRAGMEVYERFPYEPGAPLACPITATAGEDDREVTPAQLAAWSRQTTAEFVWTRMPGGHFFLWQEEARLLGLLRERLEKGLVAFPRRQRPR